MDNISQNNGHIEVKARNDDLNRNLRRYQVRLKVTASGVLIFAFWGFIKTVMIAAFNGDSEDMEDMKLLMAELPTGIAYAMIAFFMVVILLLLYVDMFFRIRIYKGARRESMGMEEKRHNGYLIITGVMIALSVVGIALLVWSLFTDPNQVEEDILDHIVSIVLEVTNLVTLVEVIISAKRLRKLRDEYVAAGPANEEDGEPADQPETAEQTEQADQPEPAEQTEPADDTDKSEEAD